MAMVAPDLLAWITDVSKVTRPSRVVWCDGSKTEAKQIAAEMVKRQELIKLNKRVYKNCYLFRNRQDDVARLEDRTLICTKNKDDVGPTNNWMSIDQAKSMLNELFDGIMNGRTMYILPYIMGPLGSKYSEFGLEVTDSPLVVLTTGILTRMGKTALKTHKNGDKFVRGLHSIGNLDKQNRYIVHFPEEDLLMSVNTNYGGNASLSKKPHALRLASVQARRNGWLAEHMFISEIEDPNGKRVYIAGALSSGSGKTNLAMIKPPKIFKEWKVRTVGDDIAWLHNHEEGRMIGINPENGFFGVAYNTGIESNPNILNCIRSNTLFTNVGLTKEKTPWWEGLTSTVPKDVVDWTGKARLKTTCATVANRNSRYSTPLSQYKMKSVEYDNPDGVPISIITFGGRRADLVPLVYEAYGWEHGILMGAMMRVETTAAIDTKMGSVRADPMAMVAFCGYNMADYFKHWVDFYKGLKQKPRIFFVNWFRKDEKGNYMWPGFSENFRIIKWMIDRLTNKVDAIATPIGYVPKLESLDLRGLKIKNKTIERLLYVNKSGWLEELKATNEFFAKFGDRIPKELWEEYHKLEKRLKD